MSNWRKHHSLEPDWRVAGEIRAGLPVHFREPFRCMAQDVWEVYLDIHGVPPETMPWDQIAKMVQRGWADPDEVRRRTEHVWQWMEDERDVLHDVGQKLRDAGYNDLAAEICQMRRTSPTWVLANSQTPSVDYENGGPVAEGSTE